MDDGDISSPDLNVFPLEDPDLADHPRFQTAEELCGAVLAHQRAGVRCYRVTLLHTVIDNNRTRNPHYVLLYDKMEGREASWQHVCTCGSGVRCGVPCRHFWA